MAGDNAQRAILRGLVLALAVGVLTVPATTALADRDHRCGRHHTARWDRDPGQRRRWARFTHHRVRRQSPVAVPHAVVRVPAAPARAAAPQPASRPVSRVRAAVAPPVARPSASPARLPAQPPRLTVAEPRASATPLWPALASLVAFAVMLALIAAGFSVRARLARVD
jgi:hypothetical protein